MSNKQNTQWLEAAKENFEQAIAEKNWHLAQSILGDINDKGFYDEANELIKVLREAQKNGMAKTGEMTIDEVYGKKMVKIAFGASVPHIRLDKDDVDRVIVALKEARKML